MIDEGMPYDDELIASVDEAMRTAETGELRQLPPLGYGVLADADVDTNTERG